MRGTSQLVIAHTSSDKVRPTMRSLGPSRTGVVFAARDDAPTSKVSLRDPSHLRIKPRRGRRPSLGMTNAFVSLPSTHARKSSRRFLSVPPLPQRLDRRSLHGKSNRVRALAGGKTD